MAVSRSEEFNAAVMMLVSVPMYEDAAPLTCFFKTFEALWLVVWPILERLEQGFGVWVVVADSWSAVGWGYPQRLQRF